MFSDHLPLPSFFLNMERKFIGEEKEERDCGLPPQRNGRKSYPNHLKQL